jgi:hypothetical protein
MLVEDGRRLLISNLALAFMAQNRGPRLKDPEGSFFSQSGYEFSRLFPQAWPNFPVRPAARMNASFPYVVPTAVLPTLPRRRVADAGYYDNYRVSVAGVVDRVFDRPRKPSRPEVQVQVGRAAARG